ncbi:hypothetical protein RCL1_007546 [Eukaryota sp. TZLM3-RCL]
MADSPLSTPRFTRVSFASPLESPLLAATSSLTEVKIPKELHSLLTSFIDDFTSLPSPPENVLAYTSSYFSKAYVTSLIQSGVSRELRIDILAEIYQHCVRMNPSDVDYFVLPKVDILDLCEVCGLKRESVQSIMALCRSCTTHTIDYEEFIVAALIVKNGNFDVLLLNFFSTLAPRDMEFDKNILVRLLNLVVPLCSLSCKKRVEGLIISLKNSEKTRFNHPSLCTMTMG